MKEKILIVEDDQDIANLVKDYLSIDGYEAIIANDGMKAVEIASEEDIKLVILDIMLPLLDGVEVCRRIRSNLNIPIIMLSAKNGDMDKILALGIGADDYMTKPFSPMELVARVKAHLRRFNAIPSSNNNIKRFGELEVDSKGYRVLVKGEEISLTSREFQLLDFLTSYPEQVFTKYQLYDNVWGDAEFMDENTVAVYVKRLREKLGEVGEKSIKTIWGVGYKWEKIG